jgi:beta-glucosidase
MGPASNIHRSPYGGRNSEYHSEDGFLAGRTLAAVTRGMADGGKAGFIKHFAVNDTEYHRVGLYTWLTEQALREVYLRPFEEAVKRGEAQGLMTAFNRVGATWTGGSEALVQGVLRNEWGFKGMIITDMIENSNLMDINQHFRAGANYVLGGSGWNTGVGGTPNQNTASPRLQHRVRENAKQVIYGHIRLFYMN